MQKILRRVATAERAVARRHKKKIEGRDKKESTRQRLYRQDQMRTVKGEYREHKQHLRDLWELGPLAPRNDVGIRAGTRGSIKETRFFTAGKPSPAQVEARCAWAGGSQFLNIAINDRVVLMEGPDKGRIGRVMRIELEYGEIYVEGLNRANVAVEPEIIEDRPPVLNMELGMPISRVRLVHPLRDPATGATRDVIINRLETRTVVHDRYSGQRRWTRVVPGLNAVIPWPKGEPKEIKDRKADTLRIDVEQRTFVPTLLRPPVPESLIDELRGKYSRFRTRHDPEYVARLEAEEKAKKDRRNLMESMRTPLQEFHRAEREKKKKKGKPRLTIEMLEKIGEVMARNMERIKNAQTMGLPEATGSGSDSGSAGPAKVEPESEPEKAETAPTPTPLETASEEPPPPPPSS